MHLFPFNSSISIECSSGNFSYCMEIPDSPRDSVSRFHLMHGVWFILGRVACLCKCTSEKPSWNRADDNQSALCNKTHGTIRPKLNRRKIAKFLSTKIARFETSRSERLDEKLPYIGNFFLYKIARCATKVLAHTIHFNLGHSFHSPAYTKLTSLVNAMGT